MRHSSRPYWVHSDPNTPAQASTIPCPGEHNDEARYAETDDEPDLRHGEPIWCERCTGQLRSALLYLPGLADALEVEIEEATDVAPERVSGTRARALHEHQAQALLIDEIRDILGQFEDEVRDWRALTGRRRDVTQHVSIERSAKFLLAHLEWILTEAPDTDDPQGIVRAFHDQLRRLDRRAMRLTHQQEAKPEPCIGVPCKNPDCSLKCLVRAIDRRSGADRHEILCEACGNIMTIDEYDTWAKQWAIHGYAHLTGEQRDFHRAAVTAYERALGAA
jgi:hypothetical protein